MAPTRAPQCPAEAERRLASSDHDAHVGHRALVRGEIESLCRRGVQTVLAHVAHDADDLVGRGALPQQDPPADRTLPGEEAPGEEPADDHPNRNRGVIAVREGPPGQERDPQRPEIARGHRVEGDHRASVEVQRRPPVDGNEGLGPHAVEGEALRRAHGHDSGESRDIFGEALVELANAGRRSVPGRRQIDPGDEQVAGFETQRDLSKAHEASREQPRAHEKDHRHGDLHDDEDAPRAGAAPARRAAACLLERLDQLDPGGLQGRQDPERKAGGERREGRDPENGPVETDLGRARNAVARGRDQEPERLACEAETQHARDTAEKEALGEKLAHQPASARSEGRTQRRLPLPPDGPRQHEVRDVGASDEEEEAHGAEKEKQRGPRLPGDLLGQGHGAVVEARIEVGPATVAASDAVQVALGLALGHSGPQPRDDVEVGRPPVDGPGGQEAGREGPRNENVYVAVGKGKVGRKHSDDGVARSVEGDGLSDDRGIGPEVVPPHVVSEQNDGGPASLVLLGQEVSAQGRPDPQDIEEPRRAAERVQGDRLGRAGESHGVARVGADGLEGPVRLRQGGETLVRELREIQAALRRRGPDAQYPLRLGVRQRPDQDGVHDAEDRGVGSDSEHGSHHGGHHETAAPRQGPKRESHVLPEGVDQAHHPRFVAAHRVTSVPPSGRGGNSSSERRAPASRLVEPSQAYG